MTSDPKVSGGIVCALALVATGCTTFAPTPYQPADGGRYGYREERIGAHEYRITVAGNAATSPQTLWDYTLLRAAELALESGHDYFVVAPNAAGGLVNIKPAFLMPQFGAGPGAGASVRMPLVRYEGLPVGVEPSRQLISTVTVVFAQERDPGSEHVFDAAELRDSLAAKVLRRTAE